MKRILVGILSALTIVSCASMPEATGEVALATSHTANAVQAGVVDKVINQDINVPLSYVIVIALVAWCVRTPWGLASDFIKARRK